MSVYVSKLQDWKGDGKASHQSCRIVADTTSELIKFVTKHLRISRSQFKEHPVPHFTISGRRRRVALENGAIEV